MNRQEPSIEVHRVTGDFPTRTIVGLALGFVVATLTAWLAIPTPDPLAPMGKVGEQMAVPLSGTKPTFLQLAKPEGEFRAFVVGASLTYGLPYMPEGTASYATLLAVGYSKVLGRNDIHVRPEARPAWDSQQILEKAEQLLLYHPDLILVVLGTNEYVNRIVHGKPLLPPGMQERIVEASTRSRVWIESLSKRVFGDKPSASGRGGFADLLRKTTPGHPAVGGLPIGAADRKLILERMKQGVRRLNGLCKKAGTKLVLVHSVQDLETFPPWCSDLDGTDPEIDALFVEVWNRPRVDLLPRLATLLARHPDRADLHHAKGRVLRAMGRHAEARKEFRRSLDLDLAPLHHTTEVENAIAEVCLEEELRLLNLNDALADEHGITGGARFLDAAHVDLEGHQELALHLARELAGQGLPELPEGYEKEFRAAMQQHIDKAVSKDTKQTGRGRIAFNDAKYFLFFGNFRDAIVYFERCLLDLPEGESRKLYEHALRKLGVINAGEERK